MRRFKNPFAGRPENSEFRQKKLPTQKLVVEIGCGVGLHPIQYAKSNPDAFIIAIEKTREKFLKFKGRLENHPELGNIYPVHASALHWIPQNILQEEVDQYFILYPNPYPKEKQKNKRFMHMPFMDYLLKTLKPGGLLEMATNKEFYYLEARNAMQNEWGMQLVSDMLVAKNTAPRTHFEKKYLLRGEHCYNMLFRK
jgi:tRNA G46 methylase TrmB